MFLSYGLLSSTYHHRVWIYPWEMRFLVILASPVDEKYLTPFYVVTFCSDQIAEFFSNHSLNSRHRPPNRRLPGLSREEVSAAVVG